jgi:RNA polymerase-binding protein
MPHATATGPRSYSLSDDRVEPAETQSLTYDCPAGHTFAIRFFAEAEVLPLRWDCPTCGKAARTDNAVAQEVPVVGRPAANPKSPWQQLRERRTIAELEALLAERLQLLRGQAATTAAA